MKNKTVYRTISVHTIPRTPIAKMCDCNANPECKKCYPDEKQCPNCAEIFVTQETEKFCSLGCEFEFYGETEVI